MNRNFWLFWIFLSLTVIWVYFLDHSWSTIPSMGKFLSPSEGCWQNGPTSSQSQTLRLKGLIAPVEIFMDKRKVPHIFAQNQWDLVMALGYITARNRLFQMDIQTRAIAGKLSEVVGRRAIKHDIFYRKAGLLESARHALKKLEEYPYSKSLLIAYSLGVNQYIESLSPSDYPIEYKLLDFEPSPWSPLKSILVLKLMAWKLTGRHFYDELAMSRHLKKLGAKDFFRLFLDFKKDPPVIQEMKPFSAKPPKSPEELYLPHHFDYVIEEPSSYSGQASNNWAVAPSKSKSGHPLLANDPHLALFLPSLWYEVQLHTPDMNVYGVTIPGAPVVVIGFNQHIAWGFTNGEEDVADLYEVRFQSAYKKRYWYEGKWHPTSLKKETIWIRGQKKPLILEVPYTHHGPLLYVSKSHPNWGLAFRWTGHLPSNELLTFILLNRARNRADFVEAIGHYHCPAQNILFASKNGDIGLWHRGRFPIRWKGQGIFISDGSNPLYDWHGFIPLSQQPHMFNPKKGFLTSTNQFPAPSWYPYFLFSFTFEEYRNQRIYQLLKQERSFSLDHMKRFQLDMLDCHAQELAPLMVEVVRPLAKSGLEKQAIETLAQWDYIQNGQKIAPTIFQEWWRQLYRAIWEDELEEPPYPSWNRTVQALLNKEKWLDNIRTSPKEGQKEILYSTFQKTLKTLQNRFGDIKNWKWGKYKELTLTHIGKVPSFSKVLQMGGSWRVLNAITQRTGPSWRMVVELSDPPRAYGVYPGGQSGNPGNPDYEAFLETWKEGKYFLLEAYQSAEEAKKKASFVIRIVKGS